MGIEPTSELLSFLRIYACSMPKLGATRTETGQIELANLWDFWQFRRVLLVRVRPRDCPHNPNSKGHGRPHAIQNAGSALMSRRSA
jgi:hypothetical protein